MTKQLLVVENLDINFELHEKTCTPCVMSALKWQRAKHWLWSANPARQIRNLHVRYAPAA